MKRDLDLSEISPFIFQDIEYVNLPENYDKLKELPEICGVPYRIIEESPKGKQGIPYKVDRLATVGNLSEVKDEFADN